MSKRKEFCNNAIKHINVKFGHQGRNFSKIEILKEEDKNKFKLDCAGLCVETARITGLLMEDDDLSNYSKIPDGNSLINHLNNVLDLKKKENIKNGDIIVMSFNNNPSHLAIYLGEYNGVGNGEYIIHSYILSRKVVIHRLDTNWKKDVIAVYSIKNIDN